jgi:hypothetical protein
MTTLIIFLLATAGLTTIVTKSSLLSPLRSLFDIGDENRIMIAKGDVELSFRGKLTTFIHKLITCPLCFGFWAGLIVFCLQYYCGYWGNVLCLMFTGSAVSMAYYQIVYRG